MQVQVARMGRSAIASLALVMMVFTMDVATVFTGEKQTPEQQANEATIRVATINGSLYRDSAGELAIQLESDPASVANAQARAVAAILQTVRPDIVLINEIDYQPDQRAVNALVDRFIAKPQSGADGEPLAPIEYPYRYAGPVNTGVASNLDLNGDQQIDGANDAWGYGKYEGQYGMAVLSRFPILTDQVRTFQNYLWSELPGAKQPIVPSTGLSFYPDSVWKRLRLSSKSHWDVPIDIDGRKLHLLASHPTPPAFDGPEDRNGCRNHDEIGFWNLYITGGTETNALIDDQGKRGGLGMESDFVILGDLNADPNDGSGIAAGIRALLANPRVLDPQPTSLGAVEAARKLGQANAKHRGDPALDTSQFSPVNVGNLRVDYCLPSASLTVKQGGVFWPAEGQPGSDWVEASDHRLVWVDIR